MRPPAVALTSVAAGSRRGRAQKMPTHRTPKPSAVFRLMGITPETRYSTRVL